MREAIADAVVGDEQKGWDPTTIELQERVADLLGHEAGLFLPSGTMCNQIAIRLHCGRAGDEIILDRMAHPIVAEAGGPAVHAGAMIEPDRDRVGHLRPAPSSRRACGTKGDRYQPRSRLVSVEQTTNLRGGRVWPLETIDEVIKAAHMHELRDAHGRRAADERGRRRAACRRARSRPASTPPGSTSPRASGAPVGAVLVGSRRADRRGVALQADDGRRAAPGRASWRRRCLYALDHNVERLADDHENARVLADAIAELPGAHARPGQGRVEHRRVRDLRRARGSATSSSSTACWSARCRRTWRARSRTWTSTAPGSTARSTRSGRSLR